MREILFRGKDIAGNWHYGVPLVFTEDYVCMTAPQTYNKKVEANTLGQFTGLIDKNGNKIFEGDYIVCSQEIQGNWIDQHIEMGYVEMKHGSFGLHRKQGYYRPFKDWLEDYEYEVLGNIHDNPELLRTPQNDEVRE